MDIDKKYKEIGNYFKNKVIDGEFQFVSCTNYVAKIIIDNKYKFSLWIYGEHKKHFDFYKCIDELTCNKCDNPIAFNTDDERLQGWSQIKPYIIDYTNNVLLKTKQDEVSSIKANIDSLINTDKI